MGVATPPAIEVTALSQLSFAVLDDNALVRKNLERVLRRYTDRLVVRGANLEETQAFPALILEHNIDIAILDLNLDFDEDGLVLGTNVARRAKALGFQGCMLLHSSGENLAAHMTEDGSAIHGVVAKTSETSRFLAGVMEGWEQFQTN
jgi:DNA-binding NarL/FixJ family response regulator